MQLESIVSLRDLTPIFAASAEAWTLPVRSLPGKAQGRIVGLYSPRPQAGRRALAGLLQREHGWIRLGFTEPVKEIGVLILERLGISLPQAWRIVEGRPKPEPIGVLGGMDHSTFLSEIGTTFGRAIDPDIWVKMLSNKLAQIRRTQNVVVDDVRFENEYDFLDSLGAFLIRLGKPAGEPSDEDLHGRLEHVPWDRRLVLEPRDMIGVGREARRIAENM